MLRHVVFFQFKNRAEGHDAQENAVIIRDWFERIAKEIPGVDSFEAGMNISTNEERFYHLCVNQVYNDKAALAAYLVHPLHLELREYLFKVIDHRVLCDYEI